MTAVALTVVREAPTLRVEEEALAVLHATLAARTGEMSTSAASAIVDSPTRRGHRELAESAKRIVTSAPGSAHPLGDLAATLGVSPSHLAHVFRAEVGLGLHQYLLHVRMAVALDRLGDGASDLS